MSRYFEIYDYAMRVEDVDRYWFLKKIWNLIRLKSYKRRFVYGIVADVSSNQKFNLGDRFIAGNHYPPIIFEVLKKLGKKAIVARSVVTDTQRYPLIKGKCIIITKH